MVPQQGQPPYRQGDLASSSEELKGLLSIHTAWLQDLEPPLGGGWTFSRGTAAWPIRDLGQWGVGEVVVQLLGGVWQISAGAPPCSHSSIYQAALDSET